MKASVHLAFGESIKKHATEALIRGLSQIGVRYELRDYSDAPASDADFALTWGHKHRCCAIARSCALPLLVVERPYFGDRAKRFSVTWNWAHRLGIRPAPGAHTRELPKMEPWRFDGTSIVVFDQVPTDIMFREVAGTDWARRIADDARRYWHCHSYVRPHPQVQRTDTIHEALRSARLGISFTSTAAVDCVLAGVPSITMDPRSMAYDVSTHNISEVARPDRDEWAHWLSWCQWTGEELEDGSALKHLLTAHEEAKDKVTEITRQSDLDGDG